jgi:hypothetical protein
MSNDELELTIHKARKLKELRRAKARVKRLERELRGEPVPPEELPYVPEFLRLQTSAGWAERANSDMPLHSERERHAMSATDSIGRNRSISRPPAPPQRSRFIENLNARSRHLDDLLSERTP